MSEGPAEQAVEALRQYVLRERDGRLRGGEIGLFYSMHPQYRSFFQGSVSSILRDHPDFFDIVADKNQGSFTILAFPTRPETAKTLHQWVVAKGRIISTGDLGQFYQRHPGAQVAVKKLGTFIDEFSDMFEVSYSDAGGLYIHAKSLDMKATPKKHKFETSTPSNPQQQAAQLLWEWLFKRRDRRVTFGGLNQFYNDHPAEALEIRGKLSKIIEKYSHMFFAEMVPPSTQYLVARDVSRGKNDSTPTPVKSGTPHSSSRVHGQNPKTSSSAGDILYNWLLQQPDRAVLTGGLSVFQKAHPKAFEDLGKLSSFVGKHADRFKLENVAPNIQRLVALEPQPTTSERPAQQAAKKAAAASSTAMPSRGGGSTPVKPVLFMKKTLERDQEGIRILPDPGEVSHERYITRVPVVFQIVNESGSERSLIQVTVSDPRVRRPVNPIQMEASIRVRLPARISHGSQLDVEVAWKPSCPSGPVQLHSVHVCFQFEGGFAISRFVALNAGGGADAELIESVRAKKEYFPHKAHEDKLAFPVADTVSFPRVFTASQKLRIHLPVPTRVPHNLDCLYRSIDNPIAYFDRFTLLLQMVQDWEKRELEMQDLRNVPAQNYKGHPRQYKFSVPGLAEKRPSVMLHDRTVAMAALQATSTIVPNPREGGNHGRCYLCGQTGHFAKECPYAGWISARKTVGGVVVEVFQTAIVVEFFEPLTFASAYHVRFVPNTFPFRMQSLALQMAVRNRKVISRLLDPAGVAQDFMTRIYRSLASRRRSVDVSSLGPCRSLNTMQLRAVSTVVNEMIGPVRMAPFLVFGPPGTGKTTTLVAAVTSLLIVDSEAKVLVCAGSNSACDVFFDKLRAQKSLAGEKMERFVAAHLEKNRPPQTVDDLNLARVIVATCTVSGKLSALGGGRRFTHVVVDEAAQCTETETLIPFSLCGPDAQWVLGGDHKQLGPVIRCKDAEMIGRFDVSLFQRIMESTPCYEQELDPLYAVLLTNNYRSHPGLLKVPSRLFYKNLLAPFATNVSSLCRAIELPFPVIARHVVGKEEREGSSPSWFNLAEVHQVLVYVRWLDQQIARKAVPPLRVQEDVIVIAPYAGQVRKIRDVLRGAGYEDLRVDSVEKFQGGEARVVIISTARSSSIMDDYDAMYHLGFLKNAKRFNVATTRARELMILVGNLIMLKEDPNWRELVFECEQNKVVFGLT